MRRHHVKPNSNTAGYQATNTDEKKDLEYWVNEMHRTSREYQQASQEYNEDKTEETLRLKNAARIAYAEAMESFATASKKEREEEEKAKKTGKVRTNSSIS